MKKLLILAFLPLWGFGQVEVIPAPDTLTESSGVIIVSSEYVYYLYSIPVSDANLTFYWDSALVRVSDSALYNRVTDDYDTNTKLLGSVSAKTNSSVVVYGDTVKLTCLNSNNVNFNKDSTLYFQVSDATQKADLTENTSMNLSAIAKYSAKQTGSVADFLSTWSGEADYSSTASEVGSGKDYETPALANAGLSDGDTAYVYNGDYASFDLTKEITFINLGNSTFDCSAQSFNYSGTGHNPALEGFEIVGDDAVNLITNDGNASAGNFITINNCYLDNGKALYFSTTNLPYVKANNCAIAGYSFIRHSDNHEFNDCYFFNNSGNANHKFLVRNGSCTFNRCEFVADENQDYSVNTSAGGGITFFGCDIYDQLLYSTADMTGQSLVLDKCTQTNTDSNNPYSIRLLNCNLAYVQLTDNTLNSELLIDDADSVYSRGNTYNEMDITIKNDASLIPVYFRSDTFINTENDIDITFTNTYGYLDSCYGYSDSNCNIYFDGTLTATAKDLVITNNSFNISYADPIIYLQIASTKIYNKVDIFRNLFNMPYMYGVENDDCHATLIFDQNTYFNHNYVMGSYNGLVSKPRGSGRVNYASSNVFYNCKRAIPLRGSPNSKIFNNTFRNDTIVPTYAVYQDDNGEGIYSDSLDFKNNIIQFDSGGYYASFGAASDSIGCTFDNNQIYGTDSLLVNTTKVTLTQWQGEGQEANSYTSNPELGADYTPPSGNDAEGNGDDLGEGWNILMTKASSPPTVTEAEQTSNEDIGAKEIE